MEDRLIELISKFEIGHSRMPVRIGDDCTYLREKRGSYLVLTVDTLTEHIHFEKKWLSFFHIGYKAMASALSDIASKGARPIFSLVDLHLTPDIKVTQVQDIYAGMQTLSKKYGFSISGGNISQDSRLSLSIFVAGERMTLPPLRSGAREGDYVYMTGNVGLSALFVLLMSRGARGIPEQAEKRFKEPSVRLHLATRILKHYKITSIMDISDGLGKDATRLAKAGRVNIVIYEELLSVKKNILKNFVNDPVLFASGSGEEYELLFTSHDIIRMNNVHRIGIVKAGDGKVFMRGKDATLKEITNLGFKHLRVE